MRVLAVCGFTLVLMAMSASAFATSAGIDTPSGVYDLPISVMGTPGINISVPVGSPVGTVPTVAVSGNTLNIGNSTAQTTLNLLGNLTNLYNANYLGFGDNLNSERYIMGTRGTYENTNADWQFYYYNTVAGNAWQRLISVYPSSLNANTYSESFHDDAIYINSNAYVGIGVASPPFPLVINAGTDHILNVRGDPSSFGGFPVGLQGPILQGVTSAQGWAPITLAGSTINLMVGDVGIRTTTPQVALDVNGLIHVSGNTTPTLPEQGGYVGWNAFSGGTGEMDFMNQQGEGSGGFAFFNSGDYATKGTALVQITGGGYVGIGKTPEVALDVTGGIRAGAAANVTACGAGVANGEGTQRYNYSSHKMEYCNGSNWATVGVSYVGRWKASNDGGLLTACPATGVTASMCVLVHSSTWQPDGGGGMSQCLVDSASGVWTITDHPSNGSHPYDCAMDCYNF
jgi:hypothetical protein